MVGIGWYRTATALTARDGATVSGFDARLATGMTEHGPIPAARVWDNFTHFITRIAPVAEEAGVTLGLHPDDPPVPVLRGIGRILTSVDAMDRALDGGCRGLRDRGGQIGRVDVGGRPNGATCDAHGRLWFTDRGRTSIWRHDPATGTTETVCDRCDGLDLCKPNDLAFDAAGNLVLTCSNDARTEPAGYVCCLAPDATVARIADGPYFPNGLHSRPTGSGSWWPIPTGTAS